MDVVNNLLRIEKRCTDFLREGSEFIYPNSISIMRRSETNEFCALSDSYNYSQTLRIFLVFDN